MPPGSAGTFGNPYGPGPQGYGQQPPNYANYPRYFPGNKGPVPPAPAIVRFAAIGEAWELIRQDMSTYVLGLLVMGVVGYAIMAVIQMPMQFMLMNPANMSGGPFGGLLPSSPGFWALYALSVCVSQIVGYVLGAGFFSLCLKRLRGQPIGVANIFDGFKFIGPLAVAGLCSFVIMTVATFLLLIPAIFVAGAFAFVPLIIVDQNAGPIEAMALSLTAAKKDLFMMGVLAFVCYVLACLGGIACCIGALFTAPIYYMTLALHYHAYFPPQGGPENLPEMQIAPQYSI